jgi:bacteriocin biosynthesis cyclodehydratase domain-containing protein
MLHSDFGAYRVGGPDAIAFAEKVLPLLDGTRDEDGVVSELARYSRASVLELLGWLRQRRLLDEHVLDEAPSAEVFRAWKVDAGVAMELLSRARVLVVGGEPCGRAAAAPLRAAGVGAVEVSEDPESVAALGPWSLVLAALSPSDVRGIDAVARGAHQAAAVSLWAHLSGMKAYLGPLVTPGRTACRMCAGVSALNPELVDARAIAGACADIAAQRLGHMMAMEAVRVLSRYAPSALGGRLLVEDLATCETTLHTLVRLPTCDVCAMMPSAHDLDAETQRSRKEKS